MFEVIAEDTFDFRSQEYAELFNGSAATAFQHPIWGSVGISAIIPAKGNRNCLD